MSSLVTLDPNEIAVMRRAGAMLAEVASIVHEHVVPGVRAQDVDQVAAEEIRRRGCLPAFLGYAVPGILTPFPAVSCISVNDRVVHGIPDDRKFLIDDVVSVDLGLSFGGYFADSAFTVVLGQDKMSWRLVRTAENAWRAGVAAIRPGARLGDVGAAIQEVIEASGFGLVTQYSGHGIGRALHLPPQVPNFGKRGTGPLLRPGMVLAIEPMATMGDPAVRSLADGWSVVTVDGSLAAHHEHTVLVTPTGAEVLTV